MVETGYYTVNNAGREDSIKSFICALLVFLAMLILIYLMLFALGDRKGTRDDNKIDTPYNENYKGSNESSITQRSIVTTKNTKESVEQTTSTPTSTFTAKSTTQKTTESSSTISANISIGTSYTIESGTGTSQSTTTEISDVGEADIPRPTISDDTLKSDDVSTNEAPGLFMSEWITASNTQIPNLPSRIISATESTGSTLNNHTTNGTGTTESTPKIDDIEHRTISEGITASNTQKPNLPSRIISATESTGSTLNNHTTNGTSTTEATLIIDDIEHSTISEGITASNTQKPNLPSRIISATESTGSTLNNHTTNGTSTTEATLIIDDIEHSTISEGITASNTQKPNLPSRIISATESIGSTTTIESGTGSTQSTTTEISDVGEADIPRPTISDATLESDGVSSTKETTPSIFLESELNMDEGTGTYGITKTVTKRTVRNGNTGYKSLLCVLLVFLVVLILISLLMYGLRYFNNSNLVKDKSENENIFGRIRGGSFDEQQKNLPAVPLPTVKEVITNLTINSSANFTILLPLKNNGKFNTNEVTTESDENDIFQSQSNEETTSSFPTNTFSFFKVIPYNHTIILPVTFNVPTTERPETDTTTYKPVTPISSKIPVVTVPKFNILASLMPKVNTSVGKTSIPQLSTPSIPLVISKSVAPLLQPEISGIVNPSNPVPTGLFGINTKPTGKIVNKQISGLTIRTANNPQACLEPVCKQAAASMLAAKNHADHLNYCDDFHSAICQNPVNDGNKVFFRNNFRGIIKTINAASGGSIKYFNSFFKQCNDYENSINRINRVNALKGTGSSSVEDAVVTSILTQSMPFFDVGINIQNNKYIFEMTLPGLNYLKTNIIGWSLRDQIIESCIAEISDGVSLNIVELDGISNKIDDCINDLTSRYLKDFLAELEPISKLPGMSFLGGIVTKIQNINLNPFGRNLNPFGGGGKSGGSSSPSNAGDTKSDLVVILLQVQKSWTLYRKAKNPSPKLRLISLEELTNRYNLGVDWVDVFQDLTKSPVDSNTKIYFSEHLDQVFRLLVNKKNNLKEMLDLWYNVQFYKNTVIGKQSTDKAIYCMDLVSQLMPEVSSFLVSELNKNRNQLYDSIQDIFKDLKLGFGKSLRLANFSPGSIQTMENRINKIDIAKPILPALPSGILNLKMFDYWSLTGTYQEQLLQLIKHYKRMLYDQVSEDVTGETLLKYFVFAFDTEPKTFPPYRKIVYQPGFTDDIAKNLPNFVKLAKQGLLLAQQLSKHFLRNDFAPSLDPKDVLVYDDLIKNFNTKYLVDKSKYNIEHTDCEIEDGSGKNFKYDSVVGDNFAFRLVSDMYLDDPDDISLPFTDGTQNETFITVALQNFCKPNNFVDFIGDFYELNIPAPIKIKNMAVNSELFAQTFGCQSKLDKKQFPFIKRN